MTQAHLSSLNAEQSTKDQIDSDSTDAIVQQIRDHNSHIHHLFNGLQALLKYYLILNTT